ncbi:hypothetical protein NX786_20260 [Telluria mixta]|uniref:Uncharacterized protein n=1 Tax=Telluria mixta TaxID=34071 RepID=A0ABT2C2R7_9BURK|nr:hypothetical protein [Telluria mixta]MCS0631664.1 hypothetical protein [Telluria mixta]WEM98414.1 hypothetical protein P0M04_12110 [Telluria mixta]
MTIDTVSQIMSQNLAVKAAAMNSYKQLRAMTASLAKDADHSTIPEKIRTKVRTVVQISNENAYRQLRSKTTLSMIRVYQQIFALRDVPLADKRKLMDAMPIIPVPVGAAFLGVAEADLHDINSQSRGAFGDMYLRRRCNSMNELLLIAQNPEWLHDRVDSSALVLGNCRVLDSIIYVDIRTAAAYTDMELCEVDNQVKSNGRFSYVYGPTYRVSDLEEIRVAKLNAQQQ